MKGYKEPWEGQVQSCVLLLLSSKWFLLTYLDFFIPIAAIDHLLLTWVPTGASQPCTQARLPPRASQDALPVPLKALHDWIPVSLSSHIHILQITSGLESSSLLEVRKLRLAALASLALLPSRGLAGVG